MTEKLSPPLPTAQTQTSQPSSTRSTPKAVTAAAAALCALTLAAPRSAHAQQPPARPDAGTILQQQTAPLAAPARPSPPVLPPSFAPKPALSALPSAAIAVQAFTFSGNTVFSAEQLAPLVNPLVGKSATLAELNSAADTVRQFYRQRGYLLAQAYLPRQDVTLGTIEITVLEGVLGQVKVNASPAARLNASFAQSVLDARLASGQVITESALQTPLLLLSDLPGVAVTSAVSAGSAVGSADIVVNIDQNAGLVTGSVDLDTQGSRFTGAARLGANLSVNNATGYGDQLSVRAQIALENNRSNFASVAWQTPVGYHGTQVGASFARLNYALIGSFAALKAEGDASITSVFAAQPLVRSRNANLNAFITYDSKRVEDRTLAVNNIETRSIQVSRIGLRGDWRDEVLGGGLNTFNLAFANGKLGIAQAAALANDQGAFGAKTQGSFGKTNLDFLRLQTLTDEVNLLATFKAQWASKNLASAEKMALGGPNDVRAYPVGEASGDQGYVGTLEARYTNPAWRVGNAQAVLAAFYDFGGITISKNPLAGAAAANNTRSLKGAGLGLTIASAQDFTVRAALAWRVGKQLPLSDTDRSPRFWLQASKSF